jgi:hydroxyacylglutathione hydrolase
MYDIIPLQALNDNYIWIIKEQDGTSCVCVDPGDAKPVIEFLEKNNLQLTAILITHHHYDHTAGIEDLYGLYSPEIFSPSKLIHNKSNIVVDKDTFKLTGLRNSCNVIATPGHTLDHVVYNLDDLLFTGDTLFSAGCGRVFEGTYQMMYNSLNTIASFPENYKIFCGHEYTENNLIFASQIEENNNAIKSKLSEIRSNGVNFITLPSTIAQEKLINPFLRCRNSDIIQNVQKKSSKTLRGTVEVFSTIRKWKDNF